MAKRMSETPPKLPKRNVVPDRLDLRDRQFMPSLTSAPPPKLNSLDKMPLEVLNQEQTSACTGFALANVVNYLLHRAGRSSEAPVSPFMIYSMARCYDEFPGATEDTGSSLRGAMKGWYKHGVCSAALWTSEPTPPPVSDPEEDWWLDAARRPLGAYYRVDHRSVTDMHVALNEAGVLYASAICHAGWDGGWKLSERKRKAWAIPYQHAAPTDGGHAFVIIGYDSAGFVILNSWGREWGDKGTAILTYEDWLEHAMDCWVAQLGVVTRAHEEVSKATTLRTTEGKVSLATDPVLRIREINPFIINMQNNGVLSQSGDFHTNESDLEDLVTHHLQEARTLWKIGNGLMDVAIYAHGGLTGEATAAETAAKWIPSLYDNKIFPIFFMWESDLWSTLENRLADLASEFTRIRPAPTAGLRAQIEKWWNQRLERTLAHPGSVIWDEMKQNAAAISLNRQSGAQKFYQICRKHKALEPSRTRVHLIGHSAGAIVHSHIVGQLAGAGWSFQTVNFMAPAVRVDTFEDTVLPYLKSGRVAQYNQFHLNDEAEQKDPTCRPILFYGRSLLYLVSESFEKGVRTPILGMEKYFRARIANASPGRIRAWPAPSRSSLSSTHGGFDDDPKTRETIINLIKGE